MTRERYPAFVRFVLGLNLAVIVWGAFVRATGSGAGCGSHWPSCNGEVIPRAPSVETLIEFSHRLTSGLALIAVVVMLVWAWRAYPKGSLVRWGAGATMILMLLEAAIGAGLVLFELVADNASMARALFMGTHLGNTFLLLAAMTLTLHWSLGGGRPRFANRGGKLAASALLACLLIGVSGAIAALGDTLFPAESLAEALKQDLSPTSHVLIQLRVLHPLIAVGGSLLVLFFASEARKKPQAKVHARRLHMLVVVQLAAGVINVLLLAPVWLQLVHLLLADLLWITLVLAAAACLSTPRTACDDDGDEHLIAATS